MQLHIDVYGITLKISCDSESIIGHLRRDFVLFKSPVDLNAWNFSLNIFVQEPPYERVPALVASLYGDGLVCYKDKNINYIVYSNHSLLIYDFKQDYGELYGNDEIFLYEKAKHTILTRLGELLDAKGIHRIHAFAVSSEHKTLMCLLPMQGGKTTSIINLLKSDADIKIIADDLCLVDKKGIIYPFFLRLGARDQQLLEGIPQQAICKIDRPVYGVKYFIDPTVFQSRLSQKPLKLTHLLIGRKIFQANSTIKSLNKFDCLGPVMESGVFGLGLPQLLEFFVRGDFKMFATRIRIIFARVFFCLLLILKTKTYSINLGLDPALSRDELLKFLY